MTTNSIYTVKDNSCAPWLKPDEATWLTEVPDGWAALLTLMERDIQEVMTHHNIPFELFTIHQLKEKFGSIRCYWGWDIPDEICDQYRIDTLNAAYREIETIIDRYEEATYNSCVICGQPTKQHTKGYILPYCTKHYPAVG